MERIVNVIVSAKKSFLEGLQRYYGLDWVSMVIGLTALYLIGEKNTLGFVFYIISFALSGLIAYWAKQYGFLCANLLSVIIAFRSYWEWL